MKFDAKTKKYKSKYITLDVDKVKATLKGRGTVLKRLPDGRVVYNSTEHSVASPSFQLELFDTMTQNGILVDLMLTKTRYNLDKYSIETVILDEIKKLKIEFKEISDKIDSGNSSKSTNLSRLDRMVDILNNIKELENF